MKLNLKTVRKEMKKKNQKKPIFWCKNKKALYTGVRARNYTRTGKEPSKKKKRSASARIKMRGTMVEGRALKSSNIAIEGKKADWGRSDITGFLACRRGKEHSHLPLKWKQTKKNDGHRRPENTSCPMTLLDKKKLYCRVGDAEKQEAPPEKENKYWKKKERRAKNW